jgi:spore coat polysaccharide biosynthesis protein SpsF
MDGMVKKITPILQARMGASRLPGKVLMQICGDSMLSHIIRRLRLIEVATQSLSPSIYPWQPIVVATTKSSVDDAIETECERLGVRCYRGSEEDVLSRFYEAAADFGAEHIMRVCCDNPLLDPKTLSALAAFYHENNYSYIANTQTPLGLSAEIFTFKRLKEAHLHGKKPYHREHVTPFMYENGIDCGKLALEPNLSHLRFTVDTPEDFAFITEIYEALYKKSPEFGLEEVLALLRERPELLEMNKGIEQKKIN